MLFPTIAKRMSIFIYKMMLVLILLLVSSLAGADQDAEILESYIIQQSPSMRLEGSHTFNFNQSPQGGEVNWSVDRSVNGKTTTGVLSATGLEATFDLKWSKGNTTYIIHARDGGAEDEVRIQVFPPDKGISFKFNNPYHDSPAITVRVLVPADLSPSTNVVSVHHGSSRANYFSYWTDWGKRAGWIIIAPHFPDSGKWAGSRGYNLGNMFSGKEGVGNLLPKGQWAYQIAIDFAKAVLDGFELNDKTFDMWGHSAGGQFTHRAMLFVREAPIRRGIPANPGWWTLPVIDDQKNHKFPYGLYHPKLDYGQADLDRFTALHGIVQAGDKDTQISSSLRQTPEANAQGEHRWARANFMFDMIKKENPNHSWEFVRASGIGHDGKAMSKNAQKWLEDNPAAENPVASFQASPITGDAPLDVTFDASASIDPQGGNLESYEWDFGDNSTGFGKTIDHRYDNPGSYQVRLTVTNNSGQTGSVELTIIATDPLSVPSPPAGLKVVGQDGQVGLVWDDHPEPDVISYNVKRGQVEGGPYTQLATVDMSAYTDSDVTNGTTYYYVVTAVNQNALESDSSVEVSVTPGEQPIETIAIDSFESKNFSGGDGWNAKWTKKGGVRLAKKYPYEGNRYAYITGGRTPGYLERALDLSNISSARLKFAGRVRSFENKDKAYVKVSPDGVNYTTVAEFTPADSDNQWHLYDIDLSAYTMNGDFRIVFEGAMSKKNKDKWFLDNIEVVGE